MVGALCTKSKLSKSSLVNSHDNKVRSLKVYYEGGVMSQRKYKAISLSTTSSSGIIQVPRLTPLNQLMSFIKGSISECVPCYPLGNGFHRKLRDILPHMVKIYSQEHYKSEIVSFSPNEYVASVGLHGAPSAKMGSMTCGLISFSNCLTLANSCLHNYLLFGLSAKETDSIVVEYLIQLHKEMVAVEKETFDIDGRTVSFKFKIFPNDLKMVAQLAGELNNAARYPTTFAKVRKEDTRSEEHTSELQSHSDLVCRLLLEKKKKQKKKTNNKKKHKQKESTRHNTGRTTRQERYTRKEDRTT